VAITLGRQGAVLVTGDGPPLAAPAPALAGGDPCGAGDSFAACATIALADGARLDEAVVQAVAAASAFVAAGGAAAASFGGLPMTDGQPATGLVAAQAVIKMTRARGGMVVATGGCFDLLHAGHLASLSAARRLGDCLIVCLNSDSSVRRLKGPGRPLVPEADRASVLAGLRAVDAVVTFDEDTPATVLDRLRPDIFAKGSDHAASELPENELLAGWGGKVVRLPFLSGRSTAAIVDQLTERARA
jgi:rfaE bifunctional protein nucleotidyltransferase chain/domain